MVVSLWTDNSVNILQSYVYFFYGANVIYEDNCSYIKLVLQLLSWKHALFNGRHFP